MLKQVSKCHLIKHTHTHIYIYIYIVLHLLNKHTSLYIHSYNTHTYTHISHYISPPLLNTHIHSPKLSHTFIKITHNTICVCIYIYIYHKLINPQSPQHTHGLNKHQLTGLLLVLARSPPLFTKKRELYIVCIWCLFLREKKSEQHKN
jgi:Golgi nucleoside diphosphatase